ncbi:hypothetical protein QBC45DRAFT_86880 [Copromyces sp. CBS 386.78]|nr:hypothetical protein QBC45DRAFT_86880 [Copromyces sp. CBS 386.78]
MVIATRLKGLLPSFLPSSSCLFLQVPPVHGGLGCPFRVSPSDHQSQRPPPIFISEAKEPSLRQSRILRLPLPIPLPFHSPLIIHPHPYPRPPKNFCLIRHQRATTSTCRWATSQS